MNLSRSSPVTFVIGVLNLATHVLVLHSTGAPRVVPTVLLCWPNWGSPGLAKTYRDGPHPDNARIEVWHFFHVFWHMGVGHVGKHLEQPMEKSHSNHDEQIFIKLEKTQQNTVKTNKKLRRFPSNHSQASGLGSWRHGPYRATRCRWLSEVRPFGVPKSFLLGRDFVRLWWKWRFGISLFPNSIYFRQVETQVFTTPILGFPCFPDCLLIDGILDGLISSRLSVFGKVLASRRQYHLWQQPRL